MLLAANSTDSSIGQQHQNYLNLPTDSPDEPIGKRVPAKMLHFVFERAHEIS